MLGDWLQRANAQLAPAVTTRTLHSYMLAQAGRSSVEWANSTYWQTALPNDALEAMLDKPGFSPFDVLIVDEAQDVFRNEYLDVLDFALSGGLAAGVWRFFGDFERQALDQARISRSRTSVHHAGGIRRASSSWQQLPEHAPDCRAHQDPRRPSARGTRRFFALTPEPSRASSSTDRLRTHRLSSRTLKHLYDEGFRGQDIIVLSPRAAGSSAERIEAPPWADRLAPAREAGAGQIPYTTIHAFKGRKQQRSCLRILRRLTARRCRACSMLE